MKNAKGMVLLLFCLAWAGCNVFTDAIPYNHHMPARKTSATSVEILEKYPEKSYVELGKVVADGRNIWTSWSALHEKLREEAGRMGADAIVNVFPPGEPDDVVQVTGIGWIDQFLKPRRHVSAIAIRFI